MRYRHFAIYGFAGKGNHFVLLAYMGIGKQISATGMEDFFLCVPLVRHTDIIHKVANLVLAIFAKDFSLDFFDYHRRNQSWLLAWQHFAKCRSVPEPLRHRDLAPEKAGTGV